MAYAKVDVPIFKVLWVPDKNKLDLSNRLVKVPITNYIESMDDTESFSLENNKISLTLKLIRDKTIKVNDIELAVPFYVDNECLNKLSTDNTIEVYVKYLDADGDIDTSVNTDLMKTYYVTDWNVNEPENKITINAVDLAYKVINRVHSKVYRQKYSGNITVSPSGSTSVTLDVTVPVPSTTDDQNYGMKWRTLELEDNTGATYAYLITNNTATSVTVHKTVATKTWSKWRIGDSSPFAIYDTLNTIVRSDAGRGLIYNNVYVTPVITTKDDYKYGIQFLRYDEANATTWAFPIISIGEQYMPVYKLVQECSAFPACNTDTEQASATNYYPIQRDMIFNLSWKDEAKLLTSGKYEGGYCVNWYYLNKASRALVDEPIDSITSNVIGYTTSYDNSNDVGKLIRIRYTRNSINYAKSYAVTAVNSIAKTFTLSPNPSDDGILVADTFTVYGSTDFIWDNEDDYKHIYQLNLGANDEEQYNHVMFNAGKNEVSGSDILGHWYYDNTKSDTIKQTFIPMTYIAKKMLKYEKDNNHIRLNNDKWEGWNTSGGVWTDVAADWDFTTTFGMGATVYTITDRLSFVQYFRTVAKATGEQRARQLAINQKENTLKGTFKIRGQRFISTTSTGDSATKWYQQGTRILFVRPQSGLVNENRKYYYMSVTKCRNQFDSSSWFTFLDVEYSIYTTEELIDLKLI